MDEETETETPPAGFCSQPGASWIADLGCSTTIAAADAWKSIFGTGATAATQVAGTAGQTVQAVSNDAAETVQTVAPYSAAAGSIAILGVTVGMPLLIAGSIVGVGVADEVLFKGKGRKALLRGL